MAGRVTTSALISTQDLSTQLDRVKLLDASYGLPWSPDGPRIGNAQFFDIDAVADATAPLPHTLPSADVFAQKAGALGITEKDTVVIYDRSGMAMAAARAWWMFRAFGHRDVFVLDGGLPKWMAEGRPVVHVTTPPVPAVYQARFRPELLRTKEQVSRNLDTRAELMIDARAAERFETLQGHIPGSRNIPYASLIAPDGRLLDREALKAAFSADLARPMAATCGSGVTACVLALALYELGREDIPVYDGSWTEWAQDPDTPKETRTCQPARKTN